MIRLALFSMVTIGLVPHLWASDAPRAVIAVDDVALAVPLIDRDQRESRLDGTERGMEIAQAAPTIDTSPIGQPSPSTTYPDLGPPPGTLGRTYQLPSRPVPLDEHPRTGMLVVRTRSPLINMHVDHMGGFRRDDGFWQFKSDRPLIPGVTSIVAVEARNSHADADPLGVRFVRLIPGRVVYLDF